MADSAPKNWIAGATERKGALHRRLGIKPGKKIPRETLIKASHAGGEEGREAHLALTLRKINRRRIVSGR